MAKNASAVVKCVGYVSTDSEKDGYLPLAWLLIMMKHKCHYSFMAYRHAVSDKFLITTE